MAVKASDNYKVYENPNGPKVSTVTRKIIEKDGLYFKDIDGTGVFHQAVELVEQVGYQQDVNDVLDTEIQEIYKHVLFFSFRLKRLAGFHFPDDSDRFYGFTHIVYSQDMGSLQQGDGVQCGGAVQGFFGGSAE